jgi:hypothetical protein
VNFLQLAITGLTNGACTVHHSTDELLTKQETVSDEQATSSKEDLAFELPFLQGG